MLSMPSVVSDAQQFDLIDNMFLFLLIFGRQSLNLLGQNPYTKIGEGTRTTQCITASMATTKHGHIFSVSMMVIRKRNGRTLLDVRTPPITFLICNEDNQYYEGHVAFNKRNTSVLNY